MNKIDTTAIMARLRSTGALGNTVKKTVPVSPATANMREWTDAELEAQIEQGIREVTEGYLPLPAPPPSPVPRKVVPPVKSRPQPVGNTGGRLLDRLRQQGVRMSVR